MRIAAVSFYPVKSNIINSKQSLVNKNKYSSDVFVKSSPSFGMSEEVENLIKINNNYIKPMLTKENRADFKALEAMVNYIDDADDAMYSKRNVLRRVKSVPTAQFKIFNAVDQKLEKYDEYNRNVKTFKSISRRVSEYSYDYPELREEMANREVFFNTKPVAVIKLAPLAKARDNAKRDIKNGLVNIEEPDKHNNKSQMLFSYLFTRNPYDDAKKLSEWIDAVEIAAKDGIEPSAQEVHALYKKMDFLSRNEKDYNFIRYDIKNSDTEKYSKHDNSDVKIIPIKDLKKPYYNFVEYNNEVDFGVKRALTTVKHSAEKLKENYKFFEMLPQSSDELEELLLNQKQANKELNSLLEDCKRKNKYRMDAELLPFPETRVSDESRYSYDDDLPF